MGHTENFQDDTCVVSRLTAELSQPDLLPCGDDGVGKVVQRQPRGDVECEPANRERQQGDENLLGPVVLIIGVHWRGDDG